MREPGTTIWVLVADAGRARILATKAGAHPLRELESLDHAAARLKGSDIAADRGGRTFDRGGHGRHVMEPTTTPQEAAVEAWARYLATRLKAGFDQGAYDQLVLAAPPAFLGRLREVLNGGAAKVVVHSLDKDLTQHSLDEIRRALPEFL